MNTIARLASSSAAAFAFAAIVVAGAAVPAVAQSQSFRFDANTTGWNVYSIHYNGSPLNHPTSSAAVPFDAVLGLPPGSARVGDLASETWIGATSAVTGDRSSLFGAGSLSYDIYYRYADNLSYAAVAIYGGDLTLYATKGPPALNTWLHWEFPFIAGEWRVGSISGPLATDEQILTVLESFEGVFLHTEWMTGPDDTNVDNVVIGFCPEGDPACCEADLNHDGEVSAADLALLLGAWSTTGPGDLNASGGVDAPDLAILLGAWGPC